VVAFFFLWTPFLRSFNCAAPDLSFPPTIPNSFFSSSLSCSSVNHFPLSRSRLLRHLFFPWIRPFFLPRPWEFQVLDENSPPHSASFQLFPIAPCWMVAPCDFFWTLSLLVHYSHSPNHLSPRLGHFVKTPQGSCLLRSFLKADFESAGVLFFFVLPFIFLLGFSDLVSLPSLVFFPFAPLFFYGPSLGAVKFPFFHTISFFLRTLSTYYYFSPLGK